MERPAAEPVEVRVSGSTLGGAVVKMGWIGVGMCLEMLAGNRRITTSTVQSLYISPGAE